MLRRFIAIVLLLLGLGQLGFRGLQRARHDIPAWDFGSVYAASRTWIHGGDPYDLSAVKATWQQSGAFCRRDVSYFATVYFPSSLAVILPWSKLHTGPAMLLWMILTFVLLLMQFRALRDLAGLRCGDARYWLLFGASLASAPFQFGLLSGQLSMPAISLCIIAFSCAVRERQILAGLLLGLALAIKPQIAGPFLLFYLLTGRWRVVLSSAVLAGGIWVVALAGMRMTHIDWIHGWQRSVAATQVVGAVNDYSFANRFRDEIVDLKLLLAGVTDSTKLMQIGVGAITLLCLACYIGWFGKREKSNQRDELLTLACLSAIILLPVYHRVYDVALLTTALAWALAELDGPHRGIAGWIVAVLSVFLVPFDSIAKFLAHHHPASLTHRGLCQTILIPHYAWALLATTVLLLLAMRVRADEAR